MQDPTFHGEDSFTDASNKFSPPKKVMVDDVTGEPLVQRSDDNVEALRKRLTVFHSQTGPVIEYYKQKGLWRPIDAAQSPTLVWENLRKVFTAPPPRA